MVRAQRRHRDRRGERAAHVPGVREGLRPARRKQAREVEALRRHLPGMRGEGPQGARDQRRQGDPRMQGLREDVRRDAEQPVALPRVHRGGAEVELEAPEVA